RVVVIDGFHRQEKFRLVGGGEQTFSLHERDHAVGRAVDDEDRLLTQVYLAQVVETVAHQPADRQPGVHALGNIRSLGKRLEQDQGTVGLAAGQIDRNSAAQGTAEEQDVPGQD